MKPKFPNVNIFVCANFQSAWDSAIQAWFRSLEMGTDKCAALVLVPKEIFIIYLKNFLKINEISYDHVIFLTFDTVQTHIEQSLNIISEYLSIKALYTLIFELNQKLSIDKQVPSDTITEIADIYLKLASAGFSNESYRHSPYEAILNSIYVHQIENGWNVRSAADYELYTKALNYSEIMWSQVLIYGACPKNWGYFWRLQAVCHLSLATVVCLMDSQIDRLESIWQGSWEYINSCSINYAYTNEFEESIFEMPIQSYKNKARSFKNDNIPNESIQFLVSSSITQQAIEVVNYVQKYLEDKNNLFIACVCCESDLAFHCELTELLHEKRISYYDSNELSNIKENSNKLLAAWLRWQITDSLHAFIHFIELFSIEYSKYTWVVHKIKQNLSNLGFYLFQDSSRLILELCKQSSTDVSISEFFENWILLDDEAVYSYFHTYVEKVSSLLGFNYEVLNSNKNLKKSTELSNIKISKEFFLKYLIDMRRDEEANNIFVEQREIYIISVHELSLGKWDCIVFCGMQTDTFQPLKLNFPLSAQVIDEHNKSCTQTGNQGEGHQCIMRGFTYCLSQKDMNQIYEAYLLNSLSFLSGYCLFTSKLCTAADKKLDQYIHPLFNYLHIYFKGEIPVDNYIHLHTADYLKLFNHKFLYLKGISLDDGKKAYIARRINNKSTNPYLFSLVAGNETVLRSTKSFELAFTAPENVWFYEVLSIPKNFKFDYNSYEYVIKNWINDWLIIDGIVKNSFIRTPQIEEWKELVFKKSNILLNRIQTIHTNLNRLISDYWLDIFKKAQQIVIGLIHKIDCEVCAQKIHMKSSYIQLHKTSNETSRFSTQGFIFMIGGTYDQLNLNIFGTSNKGPITIYELSSSKHLRYSLEVDKPQYPLKLILNGILLKNIGYSSVTIHCISIWNPQNVYIFTINDDFLDKLSITVKNDLVHYAKGILGSKNNPRIKYEARVQFPISTLSL